MQYDILTLFPDSLTSYLDASIIGRAKKKRAITVRLHDFRKYATDKHRSVDDKPYGGGPGMILKVEPIHRALKKIRRKKKSKVILLTPGGRDFTQKIACTYAKLDQLILISGHYEGFDERVVKLVDEQISTGHYVLTGGELPALTILDAVTRLLPGVLGNDQSAADETYAGDLDYVEYPQYTRPAIYQPDKKTAWSVPKILLSGDHEKIRAWRQERSRKK